MTTAVLIACCAHAGSNPAAPAIDGVSTSEFEARSAFKLTLDEPPLADIKDPDPFAQGAWIGNAYAGATFGDDKADISIGHFGLGYHFLDNVSINFDLGLGYGDVKDPAALDPIGGGLDVTFRFHFVRWERFSIYADGGLGIIAFQHEFPPGGTNFNFTLQAGVGVTYQLSPRVILMGGGKWYHISNARSEGRANNVGFDAPMIYAGLMIPF